MDQSNQNPPGGQYQPQPPPQPESFRAPGVEPTQDAAPYPPPHGAPPPTYGAAAPPPAPPKKRNSTPLIVGGVVALVALLGLGAGGYFLFNNVLNRPAIAAARVLPANTLAYFTIDPSPGGTQQAALEKMRAAFEAQPGFKEAWAKIGEQVTEASSRAGLPAAEATPDISDFNSLGSYLGDNLTVAVLPPSTSDLEQLKEAASNEDPMTVVGDVLGRNIVGVVDLDFNPLNKKGPLRDFKSATEQGAKTEVTEKYRDVEIRKYVTGTTTLYFSLLDGSSTAIVGGKPDPLRSTIDHFKDGKGLSDDATFKTLSGQVPQERIAAAYVNLTEIYKQVQIAAPEAFEEGGMQRAEGAMLMTLSAQDDGIQLDVASQVDVNIAGGLGAGMMGTGMGGMGLQVNPDAKPESATISDIPSDSLGFIVGADLRSVIQSTLDSVRKQGGETADMVDSQLRDMEDSLGLSLERDILPWMGGDYALSASAKQQNGGPMPSVVFQLKLKGEDRDKAAQSVDTIMEKVAPNAEKFDAAGGTFYTVDPSTGAVAGVGKDRLMVVYESDPDAAKAKVESVNTDLGKGLGSTDVWRDVSRHLPRDSNSIMYLDIKGVRELAEGSMDGSDKSEYEESAAPFVRPFKYLLIGSATQASREGNLSRNHTVMFLGVSK